MKPVAVNGVATLSQRFDPYATCDWCGRAAVMWPAGTVPLRADAWRLLTIDGLNLCGYLESMARVTMERPPGEREIEGLVDGCAAAYVAERCMRC